MDYLFLIIGSIVMITCVYFIIAPFFNGKYQFASTGGKLEDGLSLEAVYAELNELEMDYLMKKISKEDFEQMKSHYNCVAAQLLKAARPAGSKNAAHKQAVSEEVEEEIMRELQKLRETKGRREE
ncbi:hypothetical protein CU633_00315 [Bacillus sp. V3-13]|uniref:hypothetical protein n=1 Tax=Bacillus sp. V3-13 TaxID=2053728 RepID=UPI000C775BB1|nr:hypothetical protein [Bacillus sp. V3-13]PLR79454.1 hypothetical protein CU633_00315 [Bacillus sp. V3-13]